MNFEQLLARLRTGGAISLEALRFLVGEIETRAEAMPGQVNDETPAEDAARIEREHAALLVDLARGRELVADAERAAQTPAANPEEAARQVLTAERARIGMIRSLGRDFRRADDFVQQHIDAGTDEAAYRSAILEAMRVEGERMPMFPHTQIVRDEVDSRRDGMTAAIAAQLARSSGQRNVEIPAHARQWGERQLCEIAAECIGWRGSLRTARDVGEMFQRAMQTTSDFPAIFTNAMNVRLLARYEAAAPTYRRWAAPYTAVDFRPINVIRAGDFPALQPLNEAGEIKSGTFSESKEQLVVYPYGVMMTISRQMIVNDQLGAIDQVLGSAGQRVADWENAKAYALLASGGGAGPTLLSDSVAMFHTDHGNLASVAAAISVTSVGIGRAMVMKQTTLDGILANFVPVTLLTGPDKMTEAEQLLAALTPAQTANVVPEAVRRLQPVPDANISGNAWYLFADPAVAPNFVYGGLEGFAGPRMSSEDLFDTQGMRVKLEHDFGVAGIDYRGGFRNAGA